MLNTVEFLLHLHYQTLIGKLSGDIAEGESPNGIQGTEIISVKYSL